MAMRPPMAVSPGQKRRAMVWLIRIDCRRLRGIGIGQGAACYERNPDGAEIGWADRTEERERTLAGAGGGASLHGEKRTHSHAGQRQSVDRAHRAHTGQRGDTVRQLMEEGDPPVSGCIAPAGEGDADGEYVRGLKAGVHAAQTDETPDEEAGADQHYHGERDLGDGEGIAQAASGASGGAAAADFIQRHAQAAPGALHGGRQAEKNPGRQ